VTPDALAALHARCFTVPRPWSSPEFAALLENPLTFLLVEGDAGFLMGRAVAGEAELLTLAVAPEARRRGLGRRLVARFGYQARLRGADEAFLEVSSLNTGALALYAAAGFGGAGRRRGYYGPGNDAVVLRQRLTPRPAPDF
jgi:[ribosomal protein S18]-alanine N-acetyltransferase